MQAAKHKTLFLAAMLILGIQPLAAHTHVAQNSRLGLDYSGRRKRVLPTRL